MELQTEGALSQFRMVQNEWSNYIFIKNSLEK
jgi:hypothetical protein